QLLVPFVARLQQAVGDLRRLVIAQVQSIDVDRLVCPLTLGAKLPPRADVAFRTTGVFRMPAGALPASQTLRTEDPVELLQGELGDGIVPVDDDAVTRLPTRYVVGAGGDRDFERIAVVVTLIEQQLRNGDLASDANVTDAEDERGHGGARRFRVIVARDA